MGTVDFGCPVPSQIEVSAITAWIEQTGDDRLQGSRGGVRGRHLIWTGVVMLKNANPAAIFDREHERDHEHAPAEALKLEQKEALEHAVAKIVALGAQAGVSPDQMIVLLRSGLTVRELLDYVANQAANQSADIA